jgi:hypothetical protein
MYNRIITKWLLNSYYAAFSNAGTGKPRLPSRQELANEIHQNPLQLETIFKKEKKLQDMRKNKRLDVFNAGIVTGAKFSRVYEFPAVKKTDYKPSKAIPFNAAKRSEKYDRWLHFYLYDYFFESLWDMPERYLPLFKRFRGAITPDFSLYRNMPLAMQVWNTYRNRAIGYWLQKNGIPIVTNVRWGDERTYDFAFEGLAKGGTYAVCTNGCVQSKTDRHYFVKGLEKMVEALQPDAIVNYPYYSKGIFEKYEKQGIEIITLEHWSKALKE